MVITETYYCPLNGDQAGEPEFAGILPGAIYLPWSETFARITEEMWADCVLSLSIPSGLIGLPSDSPSLANETDDFGQTTVWDLPNRSVANPLFNGLFCDRCGDPKPQREIYYGCEVPRTRELPKLCIDCFCTVFGIVKEGWDFSNTKDDCK